jgi:hypothetical protein
VSASPSRVGQISAHARMDATIVAWRDEGRAYDVSLRMLVRSVSRKRCRAVSRSTRRMGAPHRGHGHDARDLWGGTESAWGHRDRRQRLATLCELRSPTPRGEEAEVADADEVFR